jgi:hypothetical protein
MTVLCLPEDIGVEDRFTSAAEAQETSLNKKFPKSMAEL